MKKINRRSFLKSGSASLGSVAALSVFKDAALKVSQNSFPYLRNNKISKKTLVLGMDGMDPDLLNRFMAEGIMPTFKKLHETSYFGKLATTIPPQSPVAWASFISGTNPGGHGIYDFIHRDPKTLIPHLSISRSYPGKNNINVGKWRIPVDSGRIELRRYGKAFWDYLEEAGIPASVFQVPSNFPILEGDARCISGMGTPDLLGGYGTCTFITDADSFAGANLDGANLQRVRVIDQTVKAKIFGPQNSLRENSPDTTVEATIYRDAERPIVRIEVQGTTLILKQGEWSEWVPLSFELMPLFASVNGMVRFFAKEVYPKLKIYATPVNIDPLDPALPICSPSGYSKELAGAVGRFYTQGLPADTKSLSAGLLSDDEYLMQAKLVIEENLKALDYQLKNFYEGFLFFYFSSIDQNCHMLMRCMDEAHPLYDPSASPDVKNAIRYFYMQMDEALKMALSKVDGNTTLMILSDHGFGTFRREFNLNTWLYQNGFIALKEPLGDDQGDIFSLVDWSKTKAYGLGFNGIYLNLKGREPYGIVEAENAQIVKDEIRSKLIKEVDPESGKSIISQVFDSAVVYSGPYVNLAPELLVGYQRGVRVSDHSVLGKFPNSIIANRTNKWSSDHCFDPALVPGVLISNKKCTSQNAGIWDMAPTILNSFGLKAPSEMTGKIILET